MTRRAKDPVAIARQLLAALGDPAPTNENGRMVDDATIEEWATKAADRMRRARKR